MELVKIVGGLCAIAAVVTLVSMSGEEGRAAGPVERGFASGDSSARFVAVPGD
jgi:hypothetical protein